MNETEKAIEHFHYGITHDIFSEPVTTYARLAVEALREKQERSRGCEYCNSDVMDGNPIIHRHSSGYIGNGKFSQGGSCLTHFCPLCGRPLKGVWHD